MPRKVYKPNVKAAILAAVRKALGSGKSWTDAYDAAKALKYTGKLPSLQKMYYKRGKWSRKAARKARPAKAAAPAAPASDLKALEATLGKIVKDRVRAVLDDAIAVLQRSRERM